MSNIRQFVLNESYFSYYHKPEIVVRKPTRRYSIFEHLIINVIFDDIPVFESIGIPFYRCHNNAHSLTNVIRKLENDVCFLDEEEIRVSKTVLALKELKDFCIAHLDEHLSRLSLGDVHIKFAGTEYNADTKFVDVVILLL